MVVTDDAEAVRPLGAAVAASDDILRRGPAAVSEASVELVIDSYLDVIEGLDVDIEFLARGMFSDGATDPVQQIYSLRRIVADLEALIIRLNDESLDRFMSRRLPSWMAPGSDWDGLEFDQQFDRMTVRVQSLRGLLDSMLDAYLVQVGIQQNTDMHKFSAWVAIAAIFGMTFEHMPELTWRYSNPLPSSPSP